MPIAASDLASSYAVHALVRKREAARCGGEWAAADAYREELRVQGVNLDDRRRTGLKRRATATFKGGAVDH